MPTIKERFQKWKQERSESAQHEREFNQKLKREGQIAYESGRVASVRKQEFKRGKARGGKSRFMHVIDTISSLEPAYPGLLGLQPTSKRSLSKTRHKPKKHGTTIKVNGTTIHVSSNKRHKKKHRTTQNSDSNLFLGL